VLVLLVPFKETVEAVCDFAFIQVQNKAITNNFLANHIGLMLWGNLRFIFLI